MTEEGAQLLAAAVIRQAVMDAEQGQERESALAWLKGPGAALAEVALNIGPYRWARRVERLERRHRGTRRRRGRRGGGVVDAV